MANDGQNCRLSVPFPGIRQSGGSSLGGQAAAFLALTWGLVAAPVSAAPNGDQDMRIQMSRQQTQLAQLENRIDGLDDWRVAVEKQNETAGARVDELHLLQQELGNFVIAMHEERAGLASDFAQTRTQQKVLYERLNDMVAQVQKEQTQTGARVTKVEEQTPGRALLEMANRLDALNADLNKLRGQIEKLTYDLQNAEKRQNNMYGDLDARLRRAEGQPNLAADQKKDHDALTELETRLNRLEQAAAAGAPVAAGAAAGAAASAPSGPTVAANPAPTTGSTAIKPAAPPGGAIPPTTAPAAANSLPGASLAVADGPAIQRAYDTAYSSYKGGDYATALQGFQSFVKRYPKHPLAANAQYWVGDTELQLHDYSAAVLAQRELMEKYPDSEKVPDALFVVGRAEFASGNTDGARKTWEEVVSKFPATPAADKARKELLKSK